MTETPPDPLVAPSRCNIVLLLDELVYDQKHFTSITPLAPIVFAGIRNAAILVSVVEPVRLTCPVVVTTSGTLAIEGFPASPASTYCRVAAIKGAEGSRSSVRSPCATMVPVPAGVRSTFRLPAELDELLTD